MPGSCAYNATKHALETYADSLRLEMQKFNVKVLLVEPGKYGTATAIVDTEQVNTYTIVKNRPCIGNFSFVKNIFLNWHTIKHTFKNNMHFRILI